MIYHKEEIVDNDVLKQVSDLVKSNLPAMVGEELNLVLAKAQADAVSVTQLKALVVNYEAQVQDLKYKNHVWESQDISLKERSLALDKRAAAILASELDLKVAEIRVKDAEYARDSIYHLAELAFRNPRTMQTEAVSLVLPPPTKDANGCMTYSQVTTAMNTKTTEDV
jgi:hypothetical protein